MKALTILSLLCLSASALPATGIDEPFPVPTVYSRTYKGNGCPRGPINYTLTPVDSTLGTYSFAVYLPPSATPWPRTWYDNPSGNFSKTCSLQFNIGVPHDYQYRVNSRGADVSGYVWLLDNRRKLDVLFEYYWPNDGQVSALLRLHFVHQTLV